MRVKRFVGDNVAETMGKVKRELGSDAVILQTRQFREGGFFGLFGKVKVEITAAIEDQPPVRKPMPQVNVRSQASVMPQANNVYQNTAAFIAKELENALPSKPLERSGKEAENPSLELELHNMRTLLEKMSKQVEGLEGEKVIWPVYLQKWADNLYEQGLSEKSVKRLLRDVQQNLREEDWTDEARVRQRLRETIGEICRNTEAIQPGTAKPKVVALIGPTGVGKTTTIGKLAAGFSIVDKRKVALITADTYRVAAVEQLKTFGEIIGVPVEVVMTPSGLKEAIGKHADKELIFVDTAGRSPHHDLHMSELKAFLDKAEPDFTLLVMSATTQLNDQLRVFKRFEPLTTHLIFTKLDETGSAGLLLDVLAQVSMPVCYITNGQNVPDDIEVATPERLTRYILGEGTAHA